MAAIVVVTALSIFLYVYPDTTPRGIFGYFYGVLYLLIGIAGFYSMLSLVTDSLFFLWVTITMIFDGSLTFYRLLLRSPA